ncbi:unnamed protein product [Mycena citricolor]|uniref:Crossover junction endonuclease MUS81 n=1 Tax=Mycena citricolor TaxID=2018698 RepID=A0AAD2GYN4_9AGAR|nr:unnamed protein product [Mycena citricolor]
MPRRKADSLNPVFERILQELRDEKDPDEGHQWAIYNRALKGLQAAETVFSDPQELISVKGIGPGIVKAVAKRLRGDEDAPQRTPAAASKVPARPLKRSVTDLGVETGAPVTKRRTASVPELPRVADSTVHDEDPKSFKFWYLDSKENPVRESIQAETTFDAHSQLWMKVMYPPSMERHPLATHLIVVARRDDGIVAQMPELLAEGLRSCPGFSIQPKPTSKAIKHGSSKLLEALAAETQKPRNTIDPSRQLPTYLQTTNRGESSSQVIPPTQTAAAKRVNHQAQALVPAKPSRSLSRAATATTAPERAVPPIQRTKSAPAVGNPTSRPRLSHATPNLPPVEHSIYTAQTDFPDFSPDIMRAGDYDITLVLDHRERGAHQDRDAMRNRLRRNGLAVETESLELGDVIWIATSKSGGHSCVLDFVLERKRLDDLVGSIKDGRFHEQKFRLHQSGVSRVLYLVEEYNAVHQRENWGVQINTALSSTQVVDGFLVKETKSHDDTIEYLTGLTEQLIRAHQMKDLHVIPSHMIKRHSYLELRRFLGHKHPDRTYVTSLRDFQTLNSKSGFTTVRDTWARMLLCVKGMSAEKVGAVIERWPTPRLFWEALKEAEQVEALERREEALAGGPSKGRNKRKITEANQMLKGVGGAEGGVRAIGSALSKKLYEVFMSEVYSEDI